MRYVSLTPPAPPGPSRVGRAIHPALRNAAAETAALFVPLPLIYDAPKRDDASVFTVHILDIPAVLLQDADS